MIRGRKAVGLEFERVWEDGLGIETLEKVRENPKKKITKKNK